MPLPFVGVDGEGGDLPAGNDFTHHQYTMLRAGDRYVTGPLPPSGWFDFILTFPKRTNHVAFFFDYDVTMMCRELPETVLRPLVAGQEVHYGQYRLSYRPRKEFVVRGKGRRVAISDVGTFFQCSFVDALAQWNVGTSEQRALIKATKAQRQHFEVLTRETIEYNAMECALLAELMTKFGRTCESIGYVPARWQGPGQLAKAMFRAHGIPQTDQLPEPPPGVWEAAQAAYVGGRFETSAIGPVRGPIEGWDLSGAYPWASTTLPCLMHGRWRPSTVVQPHGVYRATFTHPREQMWYGLPVRMPDGSIRWPRHGNGWYWGIELLAAQKLGTRYTVHNGWALDPQCDCVPFDFQHRLYSVRKALGKTDAGYALKLAGNSAYGVLAQSIGRAPYANPVWAGLITATTRARINEALSLDPYACYMVATDGIFTRADYPLSEVDGLGGWERKIYPEGMFIVQPGVYFVGDDTQKPKTRGVPMTALHRNRDAVMAAWRGSPEDAYTVDGWTDDDGEWQPFRQFIGLRLGLAQNRPWDIGEWLEVEKTISFDWSTKRMPNTLRRAPEGARTIPYPGDPRYWSKVYDRSIGGNLARDMARLEFVDTPEWADSLTANL